MSAHDLDIQHAPAEEYDDLSDAETEEEQSGLIPLLQQMPVSELREIARQRGWRVKGTSRADCVSALAPLLCDATETARAVTQMPKELLEALRAALVADDGSGITPTTMAQTMTALRSASTAPGQHVAPPSEARIPIKPVEAAALLIDLARWGLVLPWRDSLYGQGRHVLPWQVQRQLPPLPGWCPSTTQAPVTPTRSRDPRRFVSLLYAAWESIAQQQPAVRPGASLRGERSPAKNTLERRLRSLVQGWPYDSQELQRWAGSQRWVESAAQSLSVPPSPLLLEDTATFTLPRLAPGDEESLAADDGQSLVIGEDEELEFVCRLLWELGLVSLQSDHLVAQREQMAHFLKRPVAEQHRAAAQAYLSLVDWSELDLLLRSDAHLVLWRKPYFGLPYDHLRSLLVRLRHLLLRFLACAGEGSWCRLVDIEAALRKLWPDFSAALQSEKQSWFWQAWGLASRRERLAPASAEPPPQQAAHPHPQPSPAWNGQRNSGPAGDTPLPGDRAPADWEASQGALLRLLLQGPLHWLGFAELQYGNSPEDGDHAGLAEPGAQADWGARPLVAVRLHGLANWIWGRPTARFDPEGTPSAEALRIDEATKTISVQPGSVAPQAHTFLGHIARLEEARPERFLYRLDPRAAWTAFESGAVLSELFAEWEQVMPRAMPAALQEILRQWWTHYGQVRLYDGFGLLELRDDVTLRELEAATSLNQHIVARLSPRAVLVPDEVVDDLLREFAAKGYAPKEVE